MSANSNPAYANYRAKPKRNISIRGLVNAGAIIFLIVVASPFWVPLLGAVSTIVVGTPDCTVASNKLAEKNTIGILTAMLGLRCSH